MSKLIQTSLSLLLRSSRALIAWLRLPAGMCIRNTVLSIRWACGNFRRRGS